MEMSFKLCYNSRTKFKLVSHSLEQSRIEKKGVLQKSPKNHFSAIQILVRSTIKMRRLMVLTMTCFQLNKGPNKNKKRKRERTGQDMEWAVKLIQTVTLKILRSSQEGRDNT